MWSSKSAMALATQYNYEISKAINVLLLKLNIDTRDGAYMRGRALNSEKLVYYFLSIR